MPGKNCKGDTDTAKIRESRAYCEGLAHATGGGLIGDNPHPANTDDANAWAAGHGDYNGGVGTAIPNCCAYPAYDGVP